MIHWKKILVRLRHILWQLFLAALTLIIFGMVGGCSAEAEPQNEGIKEEAKISVSIRDLTPPVILAEDVYTVQLGQDFHLQDHVQVHDNLDENVGYECKGSFDTTKSGQYVVLLTASDAAGNQTKKNITIIVVTPKSAIPEKESHSSPAQPDSSNTSAPQKVEAYSRDYLYTDGYTMSSASEACSNDLHSSGRSGRCDPIMDADGIYTGMRLQLY